MKNIIVLLLLMSGLASISMGQSQSSIIKTQAMDMARVLLKKDFPAFIKYMHPQVIEMAGGKSRMIERMDTMNVIAKQYRAEVRKILIGNPGKVITYKKELQVTLPQVTEMKTSFGKLAVETTLIAISPDGGKNWYFIDTSVYGIKDVKKALPNLSPELVIPPAKPPKFTPDQ